MVSARRSAGLLFRVFLRHERSCIWLWRRSAIDERSVQSEGDLLVVGSRRLRPMPQGLCFAASANSINRSGDFNLFFLRNHHQIFPFFFFFFFLLLGPPFFGSTLSTQACSALFRDRCWPTGKSPNSIIPSLSRRSDTTS